VENLAFYCRPGGCLIVSDDTKKNYQNLGTAQLEKSINPEIYYIWPALLSNIQDNISSSYLLKTKGKR